MVSRYVGSFDYSETLRHRSGVDFTDNGHNKVLVKESFDKVLNASPEVLNVVSVKDSVYGEEIENSGRIIVIYKFIGHEWTVIEAPIFQPVKFRPVLFSCVAEKFSRTLLSSALFYNKQPYETRYDAYESGKLVEKFSLFPRGELEYQKRSNTIDETSLHWFKEVNCYAYFFPHLGKREVKAIEASHLYKTPHSIDDCLLEKFQVYIPDIRWMVDLSDKSIFLKVENLNSIDFEGFGILYLT